MAASVLVIGGFLSQVFADYRLGTRPPPPQKTEASANDYGEQSRMRCCRGTTRAALKGGMLLGGSSGRVVTYVTGNTRRD